MGENCNSHKTHRCVQSESYVYSTLSTHTGPKLEGQAALPDAIDPSYSVENSPKMNGHVAG